MGLPRCPFSLHEKLMIRRASNRKPAMRRNDIYKLPIKRMLIGLINFPPSTSVRNNKIALLYVFDRHQSPIRHHTSLRALKPRERAVSAVDRTKIVHEKAERVDVLKLRVVVETRRFLPVEVLVHGLEVELERPVGPLLRSDGLGVVPHDDASRCLWIEQGKRLLVGNSQHGPRILPENHHVELRLVEQRLVVERGLASAAYEKRDWRPLLFLIF